MESSAKVPEMTRFLSQISARQGRELPSRWILSTTKHTRGLFTSRSPWVAGIFLSVFLKAKPRALMISKLCSSYLLLCFPCFQTSFFLLLLCLALSCCCCALSIRFIRHWQPVLQEQNKECLPTSAEFIAGLSFPIELTAAPRLQGLECSKCFPFVLIISTLNFSQGNRIILHSVTINFISP